MVAEPFVYNKENTLLDIPALPGRAFAGFTSRKTGVSNSPYDYGNYGLHVGDKDGDVLSNRIQLSRVLGCTIDDFVFGEQVHGGRVQKINSDDRGRGAKSMDDVILGTDGLYTRDASVVLISLYADCVPLYFVGDEGKIVGVAHAGWKGTAANIGGEMVKTWRDHEQVDLQTVKAYIGPSIGRAAYEVNDTVIHQLEKVLPTDAKPWVETTSGKYKLDLKAANYHLLRRAGVQPDNIYTSGYCTYEHSDLYYSHRRDNNKTGRMAAFIGIASRSESVHERL